jgi:hypothetical protein
MTLDTIAIQRLSAAIAEAIEHAIAPLTEEIEQLRAAVLELQEAAGQSGVPAAPPRMAPAPEKRDLAPAPRAVAAAHTRGITHLQTCRVPKCPAPVLAKELCETHYRAMRRAASAGERFDPRTQRPAGARPVSRACEEPGCEDAHYARGLCRRHYMTLRARERAAERGGPAPQAVSRVRDAEDDGAAKRRETATASPARSAETIRSVAAAEFAPTFDLAVGGVPDHGFVAMPTAEVVARVVSQYRGGLAKVAEVLGRNRRTLMEMLEKLNLMEHVVTVRATERQRILAAPLRERLADLLFREKLLDDLGCLKEVDESARGEIQLRCAKLAKTCSTQEELFSKLAVECGLEDAGIKRLVWRYDLRRQLRGLKSARPAPTRVHP